MTTRTTRDSIVDAADELFYRKGFNHTSFADIADAVQISRGNFYYHFKTKDEILDAVIAHRVDKTRAMLDAWEQTGDSPVARLRAFSGMLIANRDPIMQHGCPVGTLCAELAKLGHAAQHDANALFLLFRDWLARQFEQLGYTDDAQAMALHLLVRSQGIAGLANALHDEEFLRRETGYINQWLDTLPDPARQG